MYLLNVFFFFISSSILTSFSPFLFLASVSGGGCVVMSGGPALGQWEVKDCRSYKALSLCKQSINSYHDIQVPEYFIDPNAPCPPGWESHSGLLYCFKVGSSSFLRAYLCSVLTSRL